MIHVIINNRHQSHAAWCRRLIDDDAGEFPLNLQDPSRPAIRGRARFIFSHAMKVSATLRFRVIGFITALLTMRRGLNGHPAYSHHSLAEFLSFLETIDADSQNKMIIIL